MARKQNLKLSIPLPAGVAVTAELQSKAEAAVKKVVNELGAYASHAAQFQALGYNVTATDLLKLSRSKSTKGSPRKAKANRGRVVLNDDQRKEITALLKSGSTSRAAAEKYGISTATVNNIKKEAGLVKGRK